MSNITDNPKIQVLKAGCSGIFTNYIYKAIPLAFDESMSYYETLAGLRAYLKDVILPTVNGNAEAVAELQELYITLNDYVTNYFDNLDVQEEINNKLDEMVEDGTFESILLNYTQIAKVFDTYNDMMLDTSTYVNGMKLKTLGYHYINDGGGAEYFVTNVQNDNKYQVSIGTNLWVEMIIKDSVNVKQFGAYGDGQNDDTIPIQNALNYSHNIYIPDGTYMINAVTSLVPRSDTKIELSNGAILKAIPNDNGNIARGIIYLFEVNNISINGGTIYGERENHIGTTGENGSAIYLKNVNNVLISNIILKKTWGDGIYIGESTNLEIFNVIIDNVSRNGISVISSENSYLHDITIKDVDRTDPKAGIDFEPNSYTEKLKNIIVENINTLNCQFGIVFSLHGLNENSDKVYVTINNFKDENSLYGLRFIKPATVEGKIICNNPILLNNPTNAIEFRNCQYNANFPIIFNNPYIERTITTGDSTNSAIRSLGTTSNGNFIFNNSSIIQHTELTNIDDYYLPSVIDLAIINPIKRTFGIHVNNVNPFLFKDDRELYTSKTPSGAGTVGSYEIRSVSIKDNTGGSDSTVVISGVAAIGYECLFINENQSTNYKIQLPENTYCRELSQTVAPLISIAPNSSIKLKRIDSENFRVINMVGTITSN